MICRPEEEDDTAVAGAVDFKRKEVSYMPGFDGTGPAGMGPMTGGGRGVCNPYSAPYWPYAAWQPGAQGPAYGPAFGWGPGFGRGRRFGGGIGLGWGRGFGRGLGWRRGFGRRRAYPAWGW